VLVLQNLRRLEAPAGGGLLARLKDSPILPDRQIAAAAAAARWHGAADAGPALSLVARYLDGDGHWEKRAALDLLVEIGPVGGHHAAPLHRLLAPGNRWLRVSAAGALWRVAGDAEAVLPVFGDLWRSEPGLRGVVAAAYAEMGAAAEPARPLLLEEIGRPRRHNVQEHSGTSHQVIDDEKLLDDCRTVLAA
jgi:hypothetical protein